MSLKLPGQQVEWPENTAQFGFCSNAGEWHAGLSSDIVIRVGPGLWATNFDYSGVIGKRYNMRIYFLADALARLRFWSRKDSEKFIAALRTYDRSCEKEQEIQLLRDHAERLGFTVSKRQKEKE